MKAIFVLSFMLFGVLFARTVSAEQEGPEMPEYCTFVLESDEIPSETTVMLDGNLGVVPKTDEEFSQYRFLLPRAENGRGNGIIQYMNPILPISDEHDYVLAQFWYIDGEDKPYYVSDIFTGVVGEKGELVFEMSELGYGYDLLLYRVMTLDEVTECNQFLENEIDLESMYSADGFVYVPLKEYGVLDAFTLRIQVSTEPSTGSDTGSAGSIVNEESAGAENNSKGTGTNTNPDPEPTMPSPIDD